MSTQDDGGEALRRLEVEADWSLDVNGCLVFRVRYKAPGGFEGVRIVRYTARETARVATALEASTLAKGAP